MKLLFVLLLAKAAQAQILTISTSGFTGPTGQPATDCTGPTAVVAEVDVTMNPIGVIVGFSGYPVATAYLSKDGTGVGATAAANQSCKTATTAVVCTTVVDTNGLTKHPEAPGSNCQSYPIGTCIQLATGSVYPILTEGSSDTVNHMMIKCRSSKEQDPPPAPPDHSSILNAIAGMVGFLLFFALVIIYNQHH